MSADVLDGLPTVLVLVLSADREPWRMIEQEGQRATWASPDLVPAGCRVVFYYGRGGVADGAARLASRLARARSPAGSAGRRLVTTISVRSTAANPTYRGDRLWTRVPDAYPYLLPKLVAALRWATSGAVGRFDYVFRANTSAYVALGRLRTVAAELPRRQCYAGWLGRPPSSGPPFVKGAGILLSWDVAERVAGAPDWPWLTTDDAAVGAWLAGTGTKPIPLARRLLRDPDAVARLTADELRSDFLFRCKSRGGARLDHLTMAALHARLQTLHGSAAAEADTVS